MTETYWRAEGAQEEEVVNPFAASAENPDVKLAGERLRRLRVRAEINYRRFVPVRR